MGLKSFLARPMTYRVLAVLTVVLGVMLLLGVACPYWYHGGGTYGGIWSRCSSDTGKCISQTAQVAPGWWVSLQVLEPLALLLVTVSCACLLFENYFDDVNAPLLMQELLGVFGGILGLTGCIIFVAKSSASSNTIYTTFSWSFYFTILASTFLVVASLVLLFCGKQAGKSLRLHHGGVNSRAVSPEPGRRFSQLWADQDQSSPQTDRKVVDGQAMSRGFGESLPPSVAGFTPATVKEENETETE